MKNTIGIYGLKSRMERKIYIGSSTNIIKRWSNHRSLLEGNKHTNKDLQSDFNEIGIGNFEWIIFCECCVEDLSKLEKEYFDYYRNLGYELYNHNEVTEADYLKRQRSKGTIEKMKKSQSGENNPRARLTKKDAENIKYAALSKVCKRKDIAVYYNITQQHISNIVLNFRWKDVEPVKDESCGLYNNEHIDT